MAPRRRYAAASPSPSSSSESTSDEASAANDASADETTAVVLAARSVYMTTAMRVRSGGAYRRRAYVGSVPGRRANRERDFEGGMCRIMADYFELDGEDPVYNEATFERRFRVPRVVFLRIFDDSKERPFWQQAVNATGRPQAYALQNLVAAFRVLAFGESYDRADEYLRLSKATIAVCDKKLLDVLIPEHEVKYLRQPTTTELRAIMERSAARGMPGCIGSFDCSHWEWRGFPKALAGQSLSRKKRRTIVLERICDHDLYIHNLFAGAPGSHNDLNVLGQSPLFMEMMDGTWPPKDLPYVVNGRTRTMPYYLTDNAYHKYPVFLSCYAKPTTRKQSIFNRLQEAMGKDVERLYEVLTARYHMLLRPSRFTSVAQMIKAVKAMAILHNLVGLERRGDVLGNRRTAAVAATRGDHGASDGGVAGRGVGGEVAALSSSGAAATGGDDPVGLGSVDGRSGMGCGRVGGEVTAPSSPAAPDAGGNDPFWQRTWLPWHLSHPARSAPWGHHPCRAHGSGSTSGLFSLLFRGQVGDYGPWRVPVFARRHGRARVFQPQRVSCAVPVASLGLMRVGQQRGAQMAKFFFPAWGLFFLDMLALSAFSGDACSRLRCGVCPSNIVEESQKGYNDVGWFTAAAEVAVSYRYREESVVAGRVSSLRTRAGADWHRKCG